MADKASNSSSLCIRCGKPGTLRCGRCRTVNYCGQECQVAHWKGGHKGECKVLSSQAPTESPLNWTDITPSAPLKPSASSPADIISFSDRQKPPLDAYLFPPSRVRQLMTWQGEEHSLRASGLFNRGNTCFVNSVLQCLLHTRPLTSVYYNHDHRSSCKLKKEGKWCLGCLMEDYVKSSLDPAGYVSMVPKDILNTLMQIGEFGVIHLGLGRVIFQQQDAHEFLISFLARLQDSFLSNLDKDTENLLRTWNPLPLFIKSSADFPIKWIDRFVQSQIKCVQCSTVSTRYESILDLNLSLVAGNSVEEALQSYAAIESLDKSVGWKCEKCKEVASAQKQLTIYDCPNILMIQLKRFDMMRGGGKINDHILFREHLDIKRFMSKNRQMESTEYELYAVLVHYGPTMMSGHYVSFIKQDEKWILFDDDKLKLVPASLVLQQNAYILFYRKKYFPTEEEIQEKKRLAALAQPKAADPRGKNRGKLKSSLGSTTDVTISESSAVSVKTPDFRVFFIESKVGGGTEITAFVVQIEVPLMLSITSAEVVVDSEGSLTLTSPDTYFLRLGAHSHRPSIVSKEGKFTPTFDTEKELSIFAETQAPSLLQPSPKDSPKVKNSLEAPQKPANVEQASYARLYSDLQTTAAPVNYQPSRGKPQEAKKVGRNDPCPCGSGKKYKLCHGK